MARVSLFDLKVGAGLPSTGKSTAATESISRGKRKNLLLESIASGKLKPSALSPVDAASIAPDLAAAGDTIHDVAKPARGFFGDVFHFGENLLGKKGLAGALVGIPMGAYQLGKGVATDVSHGKLWEALGPIGAATGLVNPSSEVFKNVTKPVEDQYSYQYGPLIKGLTGAPTKEGAHGNFAEFGKRFYDAPLGPLLDLASIATLGEAGLARGAGALGNTGKLSRLTSTERAPLEIRSGLKGEKLQNIRDLADEAIGEGNSLPPLERQYSRGIVARRGIQKPFDRLLETKGFLQPTVEKRIRPLYEERKYKTFLKNQAGHQLIDQSIRQSRVTAALIQAVNKIRSEAMGGLSKNVGKAGGKEADKAEFAFGMLLRGINGQTLASGGSLADRLQRMWEHELEHGHEVYGKHGESLGREMGYKNAELPREVLEHNINMLKDPKVREYIDNPTPSMLDAAKEYRQQVEAGHDELAIDEAGHLERSYGSQKLLRKGKSSEELRNEFNDYNVNGDKIEPTYVPDITSPPGTEWGRQGIINRLFGEDHLIGTAKQGRLGKQIGLEDLKAQVDPGFLKETNFDNFKSGIMRTDYRSLVNHLNQREKFLSEGLFGDETFGKMAYKTPDGETAKFKDNTEVRKQLGPGWVAIPDLFTTRWFKGEAGALKLFNDVLKKNKELIAGKMDAETFDKFLDTVMDDEVKKQLQAPDGIYGALKGDLIAVPDGFAKYALDIAKVHEPYSFGKLGPLYLKAVNKWRTLTLAYMPRWFINTAVGSAFMNLVKGVWNPKYYYQAARMMMGKSDGTLEHLNELARFRLGVHTSERIETGGDGLTNATAFTRGLYKGAQTIEDYFRTASGLHSLNKMGRERMNEVGHMFEHYQGGGRNLIAGGKKGDAYINELLSDPKMVRKGVEDVNRFAYNFFEMGPAERRVVRLAVPFWGWYRFITKFVWKMPLETPGRLNAITKLGNVGKEIADNLGPALPPWLQGAIFFNTNPAHLESLSTLGLNPFSQFANPFMGGPGGVLQLSQLNPVVGAALSGIGIDTLRGGSVDIAPDSKIGKDQYGNWVNKETGEKVNISQERGWNRFFGSLLRSVPQIRLLESGYNELKGHGASEYPESIPFIDEHPMPQGHTSKVGGLLAQFAGANISKRDITQDAAQLEKSKKYVRTRLQRQQDRINTP